TPAQHAKRNAQFYRAQRRHCELRDYYGSHTRNNRAGYRVRNNLQQPDYDHRRDECDPLREAAVAPIFLSNEYAYEQNGRDDYRQVRNQAQLEKLRKVLAVQRECASIKSPDTLAVSTQRARKRKSSLRTLGRVFRQRRHHDARGSLRNLVGILAQILGRL